MREDSIEKIEDGVTYLQKIIIKKFREENFDVQEGFSVIVSLFISCAASSQLDKQEFESLCNKLIQSYSMEMDRRYAN